MIDKGYIWPFLSRALLVFSGLVSCNERLERRLSSILVYIRNYHNELDSLPFRL